MTILQNEQTPKVFISYSWTNGDHQKWVLQLARFLNDDGIEVVLDLWDLRPGEETAAFMERMVNDDTITKVIMIIDNVYTTRANERNGGVGTESTILSHQLYSNKGSNKVVAVIAEPEANTPTFYTSRLYIDLSTESNFTQSYPDLVRWIYGQFEHQRPKQLGQRPSYITDEITKEVLMTNFEYRYALNAVEKGLSNSFGAINSYLNKFSAELAKLSVNEAENDNIKDLFLINLKQFQSHLLEYKLLLDSVCIHNLDSRAIKIYKKFLENTINYQLIDHIPSSRFTLDLLLYKIFSYQLFLSTISILFKHNELKSIKEFLDEIYIYPPTYHDHLRQNFSTSFNIFSLSDIRNLNIFYPQSYNPLASLIKKVIDNQVVDLNDLVSTDIMLYLKSASITLGESKKFVMWNPHLAHLLSWHVKPMPIFIKAERIQNYFELANFFNNEDLSFINTITTTHQAGMGGVFIPKLGGEELDIKTLTNYVNLEKFINS